MDATLFSVPAPLGNHALYLLGRPSSAGPAHGRIGQLLKASFYALRFKRAPVSPLGQLSLLDLPSSTALRVCHWFSRFYSNMGLK